MDLQMVVKKLRIQFQHIPLIMATASPTWKRTRNAFLMGATDYIRKSTSREELLAYFEPYLRDEHG